LSSAFYIGKNQKSYNSEIGIPLAILGRESGWNSLWKWSKNILEGVALVILPNVYPKWLVVEAGVDQPGDMDLINKWIKSDFVVFTKFAKTPVHVEFFDSPQGVLEEKRKLIKSLKSDGVLILNADDKDVLDIKEGSGKHAITYGFSEEASVRASNLEIFYKNDRPAGISFKVNVNGNSLPVILNGVLGVQHVYPVLSALAVGQALNLNLIKLVESFKNHSPAPGRMRILDGIYGSTIIDDSYNSSPVAVEEALQTLRLIEVSGEGRKIAVLGDMMELGKFMKKEHLKIGEFVMGRTDILMAVGERSKNIVKGAEEGGFDKEKIYSFNNSIETGEFLKDFIKEGDVILVKGSQSPRLEKIVFKVLAKPDDASFLLVRQEKEWERR